MSSESTEGEDPVGAVKHRESDEQVAANIHDFKQLLKTGDLEGLVSALQGPDLFRMACDDERYMRIAMQGIAVLAWDQPALASELLVRFDTSRSREDPRSDARRAARALMAALEWRQLETQETSPVTQAEPLRDFLRLYPALAGDAELGAELRADLQARPEFYADFFRQLQRSAEVLPEWIFGLEAQLPGAADEDAEEQGDSTLRGLSESQLSALSTALSELRGTLRSRARQYVMWLLIAGVLVALPNAAGALLALLILGGSLALGENKTYEQVVRPRLISLAIDHGVGAKQVVSVIYRLSGRAGKVGNFDIKIENDGSLDLLAAVSRSASPSS